MIRLPVVLRSWQDFIGLIPGGCLGSSTLTSDTSAARL